MENSAVTQIFLNDRYVVVQSAADAYNATNPQFELDNTWIFSKGSRTYLNAYYVIGHDSSNVELYFDRERSRLYIAEDNGFSLHEIGDASLVMNLIDEEMIGKSQDLIIISESIDYPSSRSVLCTVKFTVSFISSDNMTIFATGLDRPQTYSVNYPNPI